MLLDGEVLRLGCSIFEALVVLARQPSGHDGASDVMVVAHLLHDFF